MSSALGDKKGRVANSSDFTKMRREATALGAYASYIGNGNTKKISAHIGSTAGILGIKTSAAAAVSASTASRAINPISGTVIDSPNTILSKIALSYVRVTDPPGQVLYATYPKGSQSSPPYLTVFHGDFTVTVAGAGGGKGYAYTKPGYNGGLVTYTFRNIPVGTPIYYIVGGAGEESYNTGGGGAGSAVSIGDIAVIAGGGNGNGAGVYLPEYSIGAGGTTWGSSPIPNLLTSLEGGPGVTFNYGGAGGGANPGSGSGPPGSVITPAGAAGGNGYVRIVYSP